jgi:molecular chaperone GrpE
MEEKKDLNNEEILDEAEETTEETTVEENAETVGNEEVKSEEENNEEDQLSLVRKLNDENKKLNNEVDALRDRLLRITAEYENYRKRTAKEKDGIYTDACTDVLKEIIPVVDNLERALAVDGNVEDLKKGIEMTIKGFQGSLEKLGVEEIDTTAGFDPNLHQAVMHIQDDSFEKNSVAEVFLKGYKRGDKVIRFTMVKVAN